MGKGLVEVGMVADIDSQIDFCNLVGVGGHARFVNVDFEV